MPSPLARKSGRRAAAHGAAVISPAARTGRSVLYGNMSPSSRRPAGGFSKACRPQKRMAGFPAGRQNKYAIRQHGKGRRTSRMAWGIRARPGGARGSCTRDAGGRAAFRRPGGPPARIATRDADPAARRRVAGHAGAWRAGGAPGAGRTAIRGASCGIAEDAGRQLRLRPGRGAASGSVSRRGAPAPRDARATRSGGFALRKLRPAISTGENFATNGAVRVAVWPQRAKFLASDRAAACLGHSSRCAAGAACPGRRPRGTRRPRGAGPRSGSARPRRCGQATPALRDGESAEGTAGRRAGDRGGRPCRGAIYRSSASIRQASAPASRGPAAGRGGTSGQGKQRSRAARARRNSPRSAAGGGPAARRARTARRPRPAHSPPRTRRRSRKTTRAGQRRTRANR